MTSLFIDGELSVISDDDPDSIRISATPSGNVQIEVNGVIDPSFPANVDASLVESIIVHGSDQANQLDLRTVNSSDFDFTDPGGNPVQVTIEGHNGDDTIYGSAFGDTILGGDGIDRIEGRDGNDAIDGGDGNDLIYSQNGDDTVDGADGRDFVSGGSGDDSIKGGDGRDTLDGSTGDDIVLGGNGRDVIHGNTGNDTLNGESGRDTVRGEAGADSLIGGSAGDLLDGGTGDDTLLGQGSADTLVGGDGDDSLNGGTGNDTLNGNDGNDRLSGAGGRDTLEGGDGDDSLYGGGGNDLLFGDSSDPFVTGDGNDVAKGQGGNDTLYGGGGADRLEGGTGNDLVDSFLPQLALAMIDDVTVNPEGDVVSFTTFATGFETGAPSEFSGFKATESVQGFAGLGTSANVFSGDFLRNDSGCCTGVPTTAQEPTRLTLVDLPAHTSIDIDFLLAVVNSWNDDVDSTVFGPDDFNVTVDGTSVFSENFRNIDGSRQGYQPAAGVALTPAPLTDLGFPGPSGLLDRNDAAYDMGLDPVFDGILHTADTLTIEWFADGGWEGGSNESWGIDNVEVTLNGVPVTSIAMFTVSLSKASGQVITVDYSTIDGTATAGADYVGSSGVVTFPVGSVSRTIGVPVIGDTEAETDETFTVSLFNPVNVVFADSSGEATIIDDDTAAAQAWSIAYLVENASDLELLPGDIDAARVTDQYVSQHNGLSHTYLRQTHGGLDVYNGDIGIHHVMETGEVIALTTRFVPGLAASPPSASELEPAVTPEAALASVVEYYGWDVDAEDLPDPDQVGIGDEAEPTADHATELEAPTIARDPIPVHLHWMPDGNGGVELAWNMTIETIGGPHLYDVSISAEDGGVLRANDLVRDASYRVFEVPVQNPLDGSRTLAVDPADPVASPSGWHDDGTTTYTDTRGNNTLVQEDANQDDTGGNRPDGGAGLIFDFPLDLSLAPSSNEDAAIANGFYWSNITHDIHYRYGFDEASGNFQTTNFTGNGLGNDPVIYDVLDPFGGLGGFSPGPHILPSVDGSSPRINMGPNTGTTPNAMAAMSNEIFVHEFGHGVSLRLVGGPSTISALSSQQGGGMGEGWGDWHALMLNQKTTDTKLSQKVSGDYYLQSSAGIRNYPYTFDMNVNPLTYESYNGTFPNGMSGSEVHNAGEIWASALWDMNWLLIDRCGFDADFLTGSGGNTLAMQLGMDGMKLTATDPSFLDARDAILAADVALSGGENAFDIWTAFARRGMGASADDGSGAGDVVTEAFDIPAGVTDPGSSHSCFVTGPGPPPPPPPTLTPDTIGDTLIGNAGNDTLYGALGDDQLNGGGGADLLDASGGNDGLLGGGGRDSLNGGIGDDTLNGQGGVDRVDGGDGNDVLIWRVGDSSDSFFGTQGYDELIVQGTSANNKLTVRESLAGDLQVNDKTYTISVAQSVTRVTINAGPGNDRVTIEDTRGASGVLLVVNGQSGGDTIDASGADLGGMRLLVQGGDGSDTITGSDADDLLRGEVGNDVINGGAGDDTIDGGDNHDVLGGGAGNDSIVGALGNDTLSGDAGDDLLQGSEGHDNLNGNDGDDTLEGQDGNDLLNGSAGNDSLLGADGRDSLYGGIGHDFLDGGVDDDVLNGNYGDDTLAGRHGEDRLIGDAGDDLINGGDGHDTITGGTGDDLLGGGDGDDHINAGAGADSLVGGDGQDTLLGGGGADIALGGDGNDFINGNGSSDTVAGNEGSDQLGANFASEIDEAFQLPLSVLNLLDGV